jgi:hypothetical protein
MKIKKGFSGIAKNIAHCHECDYREGHMYRANLSIRARDHVRKTGHLVSLDVINRTQFYADRSEE